MIAEPDGSGYYPCKPDIFAATYKPADAPTPESKLARLLANKEREACAAIADRNKRGWELTEDGQRADAARIAVSIRARGGS